MPDTLTYVDGLGNAHPLVDPVSLPFMAGHLGRFMAPLEIVEAEVPLKPGARRRNIKTKSREVTCPLVMVQPDEMTLRTAIRSLAGALSPSRGVGQLQVTAPDGSVRVLNAIYSAGFEGDEGVDKKGRFWYVAALVFHAFDPYWYDQAALVVPFSSAGTGGTTATFFPFFPLRLGASQVFSQQNVVNAGDEATWPVWTITGPGSNPVLLNVTTGQQLQINVTLAAGEQLVIDTRDGIKTVTRAGANLYTAKVGDLWSLAPGVNVVQVQMTGTTAASLVNLSYFQAYQAA